MRDPEQHSDDFANSFETAFARLQIRVETACAAEADWSAQVAAAIRAALAFAAADPESADVLTNGAMAEGRDGFARYERMLAHFGEGLRPGRAERPHGEGLPETTEKAMVAGFASLIANRLHGEAAAELPGIAPEAIQFVLTPYLGAEDARRLGAESA